jgi:putative nucleotidyltransferase with HDIG domain
MRACRFVAVLGFRMELQTRKAIPSFVQRFRGVAVERVQSELSKLLCGPYARHGIDLLRKTGLLEAIVPELIEGVGLRQNRWHRYDVYHHVLRSVEAARADLVVRLAALLHDIDKPRTAAPSRRDPAENSFYGHELSGASRAKEILERLRYPQRVCAEVALLVREHQFAYSEEWTDAAVRRMLARVGDSLDRLLAVREADLRGHGVFVEDSLANLDALERRARGLLSQKPALTPKDLAIDGAEVMRVLGIGPSPKVGAAMRHLLDQVIEQPSRNNADELRTLLRDWSAQ